MKHLQKLLIVLAIIIISLLCYNSYTDDEANMNNESNETLYPGVTPADPVHEKTMTPEEHAAKLIEEDKKNIAPDQDEIINKIKTIDLEDSKAHHLLKTDDMNQLFNNFVYFKNFIVHNFDKDKIIRFCIEFINQIYPETHKKSVTVAAEKSTYQKDETEIEQHAAEMPVAETESSDQNQHEESSSPAPQDEQPAQTSEENQPDQNNQETESTNQPDENQPDQTSQEAEQTNQEVEPVSQDV